MALTVHITSSVGWLGAVVTYLVLVVAALKSQDAQMVRAAWIALELTGWYAVVPLCLISLLSGVVQALGTSWGLFRHYWVVFKLLLTGIATAVLLLTMPTVSQFASTASEYLSSSAQREGLEGQRLHAGGGLLVLVVITVLSVYKPRGMTPYGMRQWRKNRAP